MDPDRWKRIEEIYRSALGQPEQERSVFLLRVCGGDEVLLREVEEMLTARGQAGSFLTRPAAVEMGLASRKRPEAVLLTGKRLGIYEVGELIGAGGMGQVYRARDTRLRRNVAIKALPDEFAQDAERVARFEREATLLASLNHPNIAAIHGLEEYQGKRFLVLELVEGQTLAERLGKGRIPLNETLDICSQIAEGLGAAHHRGIIHRDLKPGNVMVTEKRLVKVLDFGLAKLTEDVESDQTETSKTPEPHTEEGRILGTASYMSPEQAEGKKLDARSDVFSLGSLIYEMVAGHRAFEGASRISTLSAILHQEPRPVSYTAHSVPAELEKMISRCLRKDPAKRFQHIDDVKVALDKLKEAADLGKFAAAESREGMNRHYLWLSMILVAGVVLGVAGWRWYGKPHPATPGAPMSTVPLVTYSGAWNLVLGPPVQAPSFSPDGNEIAFAWNQGKEGNYDIYRKMIGPGEPLRLTKDPAADLRPAWSPDGRLIAFLRELPSGQYAVYLVPALGGPERRLADAADADSLDWSPDNKWLVVSDGIPLGLHLVSVETGEKRRLTSPSQGADTFALFSPDGHALAFVRFLDLGITDVYRISLAAEAVPGGDPKRLTYENRDIRSPVWTRDGKDILYSDGTWWSSGRVVRRIPATGTSGPGTPLPPKEPIGDEATDLAVAATGDRLAYTRRFVDSNIYRFEILDNGRRLGPPQKFIASTREEVSPEYSPDGRSIVFVSTRSGTQEIWLCNADGSNPRQLTSMGGPLTGNPSWSPDGQTIVFDSRKEGNSDLYLVRPQGGQARRLTSGPGYEGTATWSRDGKWIYFQSDRRGRAEICRVSPTGGEAVQVTSNGAAYASESADRRWLYYAKPVAGVITAIWRMPVNGGQERQTEAGHLSYHCNFVVVGDGVYFTKVGGTLEFRDSRSRTSRTIARFDLPTWIGLAISPDHRWILCSLLDQTLNDLMLVENFR